jgi:S1-C subfamily serine protease
VEKGSPAEAADLREGDLIVAYGERPISGVDDLHRLLTEEQVGVASPITFIRHTEKIVHTIVPVNANDR